MTRTMSRYWAMVLDRSGTRILVERGVDGRARLPVGRTRRYALPTMIAAFKRRYGIDSPFIRFAAIDGDPWEGNANLLAVFDAPRRTGQPAPRCGWTPLDDVKLAELVPAPLAAAARDAIDEWHYGPPPARAEWERRGWFEKASAWLRQTLAEQGLSPSGEVRQLNQWPLASILISRIAGGRACFKAAFPLFAHEPAVTSALAAVVPGQVPEVLAVDRARGWLLMRAFRERPLGEMDPSTWGGALGAMAGIHRTSAERLDDMVALGVPRRELDTLAVEITRIASDPDRTGGLTVEERDRLASLVPAFARASEELVDLGIPSTLIHGDFHPFNVTVAGNGYVIFDWSDAAISHPFIDVVTFTRRTRDLAAREAMRERYVAAWADSFPRDRLRRGLRLAEALGALYQVVSYREILAAMAPDDRHWLSEAPSIFFRRALDAWAEQDRS